MTWLCAECGMSNDGGLFCIGCGSKKPEIVVNSTQDVTIEPIAKPNPRLGRISWITTGSILVVTIAFGGWQASLADSENTKLSVVSKKLSYANNAYSHALDKAQEAESLADLCYYASWCSYETWAIADDSANTAKARATAAGKVVAELKGDLSTAKSNIEKYESVRNTTFIIGGVATAASFTWAIIGMFQRKKLKGPEL